MLDAVEAKQAAALISLLNAVLRPTVPIESAEILHAQPERAGVGDKSIALDVRARLASGDQVDVEMQSQRRPAARAGATQAPDGPGQQRVSELLR